MCVCVCVCIFDGGGGETMKIVSSCPQDPWQVPRLRSPVVNCSIL